MSVYKNEKNGKWYARGCVNRERYHKLLEGAKGRPEAIQLDAIIRRNISLKQKGLLEQEKKRYKLKDGIALWETASKKNVDYEHDKKMIKIIKEYFNPDKTFLDEITLNKATAFQWYVLEEMPNARTKQKGHKPATANRYVAKLRKIISLSVQEGYLMSNPLKNLKDLDENNERTRFLKTDEEVRLFNELAEHIKPIVTIELRTGLRRSKVLQLKWQDIDFENKIINITKTKKGKPVPQKLYLSKDAEACLRSLPRLSEYVFTNPSTGKAYTTIYKGFKEAAKRAKVDNLVFHDLRHTVGSRMIDSGANIRTVQEQLGHSTVIMTQRYTHPTTKAQIEAVNNLDNYSQTENDDKNNNEKN